MINWTKLLQVKLESSKDAPGAIRQIAESMSDNMLLNIIQKCKDRGHDQLLKYLEEERINRGLELGQ